MTKIYIVVDACSGEDYSTDDPTILFATTDYKKALSFWDDEIENWEDGMTNYDSNVTEYVGKELMYECTDFDGDSHRIMRLVEKEI